MYGDIIPPKKKYHIEPSHDGFVHDRTTENNSSVHFSPIRRQSYTEPKSKKNAVLLIILALIVVGVGVYHKVFNGTTIVTTPKTTRFSIQQKIPLILQNRQKDSLTYSLVYVPEEGVATRNPFMSSSASSTASVSSSSTTVTTPANKTTNTVTMTSSSSSKTLSVHLINKTNEITTLRTATRFDVEGEVYTLDAPVSISPSSKTEIDGVANTSTTYKIIGFKGTSSYDNVYAVLPNDLASVSDEKPTTATSVSSAIPPEDILALMPKDAIALQKSTIYDRVIDQSAIVVFDEKVLENFLNDTNIELQEYFKALKPFGTSVSYVITVVDYTLVTSPETGKPVSFSDISFDITPVIDDTLLPQQFAGFKKDTMDKISKQAEAFISLHVSYTPFWSKSVAEVDRVIAK